LGTKTQKKDINMRLCVISSLYHPFLGGLGRQAQLLTEKFAEEGLKVFVITRKMKGTPSAFFSPKVKVYRVWSIRPYIHTFEKVKLINILISLTFSISCAILVFRKRRCYDVVHFHGASLPLFSQILLLKFLDKKIIAKVAAANIGTEAGSFRGRFFGIGNLLTRLLRLADAFIATTIEIENGLLNDGFSNKKIMRIPNFIDFKVFSPASIRKKIELRKELDFSGYRIVLFSGKFIVRKGVKVLLEAWREVIRKFPDAHLILLGDGPIFGEMIRKAVDLGIDSSVYFRGHMQRVTDFLQAADIFVLPSLQEGMPNSLLEAMACGLAPVATRIGGVTDIIIDNENGVLVEPDDSYSLAQGILKLLVEKELVRRIALNAHQTIRDFYSIEDISKSYRVLYQNLLNFS
jgi:glycosyltransferase involved in cell wall biosynthesis